MILETAPLQIKPGQTAAFEAAFARARLIIASMPGYLGHELQRCLEDDHQYVLLVRWQTLEDHTVGFRQSPQYQQWRVLLHHFYDPFPTVLHYAPVAGCGKTIDAEPLRAMTQRMPTSVSVVREMRDGDRQ